MSNALTETDLVENVTKRPINTDQLIAQLNWRYATKKFIPDRKIGSDDWAALEEALRLAPSSGGLQPWKFIVVTDPAIRARLLPASYNQAQITDASHLVVFASKSSFGEDDVEEHLKNVARVQGTPMETLAPLRNMLVGGIIRSMDESRRNAWARNQAYIALGTFLTSAALLGIDACPMEGFDHSRYDEILGLRTIGLESVVIAAAGFRSSTDRHAGAPKVRFPLDQVIARL